MVAIKALKQRTHGLLIRSCLYSQSILHCNMSDAFERDHIAALEGALLLSKRREEALLERVYRLEVQNLELTIASAMKSSGDANAWVQALALFPLEEATRQLEETVLKAQIIMAVKPEDETVFTTPPLSQYENSLDVFPSSEFGDSSSLAYDHSSAPPSSPEWHSSPTAKGGATLVSETPPSSQGSERLSGHKRPREHTTQELMDMAD